MSVKQKKYGLIGIFLSLMFTFLNFNLQCSSNNSIEQDQSNEVNLPESIEAQDSPSSTNDETAYTNTYYPIYVTIDFHVDPMPEFEYPGSYVPGDGKSISPDPVPRNNDGTKLLSLISGKINSMDERLSSAEWVVENILPKAKVSFLVSGEFMEFCLGESLEIVLTDLETFYTENSSKLHESFNTELTELISTDFNFYDRCENVLTKLYESGGSIGSHSHQGKYRTSYPFSWMQLHGDLDAKNSSDAADIEDVWESIDDWISLGISEFFPHIENQEEIVNFRGAHVPNNTTTASSEDGELYHGLMESYGFSFLEAGPDEIFYKYFQHYVMNPYRPHKDHWLQEDTSSTFVLIPSAPVIGKDYIHFGIPQDLTIDHMKTLFLQIYGNWRDDLMNNEPPKIYTLGFAFHAKDLVGLEDETSEAYQISNTTQQFLDWLSEHFVDQRDHDRAINSKHDGAVAELSGRKYVYDKFIEWENNLGGSPSSFSYPHQSQVDANYPYLLNLQSQLKDAYFVDVYHNEQENWIAYEFIDKIDSKKIVMIWTVNDSGSQEIDVSDISARGPIQFQSTLVSIYDRTGSYDVVPANSVAINQYPKILVEKL